MKIFQFWNWSINFPGDSKKKISPHSKKNGSLTTTAWGFLDFAVHATQNYQFLTSPLNDSHINFPKIYQRFMKCRRFYTFSWILSTPNPTFLHNFDFFGVIKWFSWKNGTVFYKFLKNNSSSPKSSANKSMLFYCYLFSCLMK